MQKKYEGLLYNEEHEVSERQQTDMYKDTNNNKNKFQTKTQPTRLIRCTPI